MLQLSDFEQVLIDRKRFPDRLCSKAWHCLKVPWHEFFDTALGMAVQNGMQCFRDIGDWVDVIELTRRDDRREQRPIFGTDLMSGE
jgi:hypothetical protein